MSRPKRILIVECIQEVSSFNPLPSQYANFHIQRGDELFSHDGLNTHIGGALKVFRSANLEPVMTISAWSGSAGLLSAEGWKRLSDDIMDAVKKGVASGIDDQGRLLLRLHTQEIVAIAAGTVELVASADYTEKK